ncbi:hypothetical protein ACQ4WX_01595 [Streptomyces lasalocidi]
MPRSRKSARRLGVRERRLVEEETVARGVEQPHVPGVRQRG